MAKLKFLIIPLSIAFFVISIIYNLHVKEYQHFSLLSESFLSGKLYFLEQYSSWWHDAVNFGGHNYWPQGPFPAILLMPFVAFAKNLNIFFYQSYVQIFLNVGVYLLVYKLARKFGHNLVDGLFFAFAFCFATIFIGVSFWPTGWFYAQVVAVFLTFLAFNEFFTKKRIWIVGCLFGLVFLTRVTAFLGILFVFWEIFFDEGYGRKEKIKSFFSLIVSVAPFIIISGIYNYLRFGNFLEQGYAIQSIAGNLSGAKEQGLFGLVHIPGNIYYFLLAGLSPIFNDLSSHILKFPFVKADPWGLGIIFTSPYLLYLFTLSHKDKFSRGLIFTILIISILVFSYYGIGWYQFGYRYSLDFLPLIFILFMRNYRQKHKNLSPALMIAIILSGAFNLYLFSSIFSL